MPKLNTFVVFPVLPDYIEAFLKTLKQNTPDNYQVIVVDQTKDGCFDVVKPYNPELYIRSYRNLGFSKAANTGAKLATTPYVTICNDDVEFINPKWWQGIEDTFAMADNIVAVNPECPKYAMWGYGCDHYTKFEVLGYKDSFTEEGYQYLLKGDFSNHKGEIITDKGQPRPLPESFPLQHTGICDGIATWLTVFKRDVYWQLGGFDEKYYPGGGEDHDINARAYSKGLRMVGSTKSWVWHHWSSSRDHQDKLPSIDPRLVWNNHDELWPPQWNMSWDEKLQKMIPTSMDPWGHVTLQDGTKVPMRRISEVHVTPL
jgi:GT2 family glycosyltransferase